MFSKDKSLLLIPPTVAAVADTFFTLNGQAGEYWSGGGQIEEGNPVGFLLLSISPLVFIAAMAVWILAFNTVLLIVPQRLAYWMSLALMLSHLYGTCSWIIQQDYGLLWVVLVCVMVRIAVQPVYFAKRVGSSISLKGIAK